MTFRNVPLGSFLLCVLHSHAQSTIYLGTRIFRFKIPLFIRVVRANGSPSWAVWHTASAQITQIHFDYCEQIENTV